MVDINNKIWKITIVVILLLLGIMSTKLLSKSKEEVVLDEVKLKENISNKKGLAIYLETASGSGTYNQSESSVFPTSGYTFNSSKSGCVDKNDNIVDNALTYNSETNKVNLRINREVKCYVYFDKEEQENSWVYYGWDGENGCSSATGTCATTYETFDAARGNHYVALRSNTGSAEYDNIDGTNIIVQTCGLINDSMVCYDYHDSSRGDNNVNSCVYDSNYECRIDDNGATCGNEIVTYCTDTGDIDINIEFETCDVKTNTAFCYTSGMEEWIIKH